MTFYAKAWKPKALIERALGEDRSAPGGRGNSEIRVRITFLIRSVAVGGAERQLLNVAAGLVRLGHSVSVITLYEEASFEPGLIKAGVAVRCLGKRSRWDLAGPVSRLIAAIRSERPDVVHGYLTAGNLLAEVARLFSRGAVTVWGLRASDMDLRPYGAFVRAAAALEKLASPLADRIVANSEAGRRHVARVGFPEARLRFIPNGIDTREFRPDPVAGQRARSEWGIEPEQKLVGLVGRLDPMKDHPTFLRAGAILLERLPAARFVCVGDGPRDYAERLRLLAASLGFGERLLWAGARSDMTAVYNALDLLCSASCWGEGFPNVVGEAMACGIRCAATDVGDSARIVGDTGVIVSPGDPGRLARAIEDSLLRDENEAQRLRRRRRIVEEFGVEALVARTERLFQEALEERRT
jgi:glycosyltransferase involved in cell wall biosynthesis